MDEPNPTTPPISDDADATSGVDVGNYEVIRRRLLTQAESLHTAVDTLNTERTRVFGSITMAVSGTARMRTHHNATPCDILHVGGHIWLGCNTFLGMKQEIAVHDSFSVHELQRFDDGVDIHEVAEGHASAQFLTDPVFVKDFQDLFRYYRGARLLALRAREQHIFAVFQFGQSERDRRVFRWNRVGEELTYIDNRGDHEALLPRQHDFGWRSTTRSDHVHGPHPHVAIDDRVFVETVGGDLTIKVENNTKDGLGIYREPVDDPLQTLDDGRFEYALIGDDIIALRVRPYNESTWRYFLYNDRSQTVSRVDRIASSCVTLPEDQGVVFPGGFLLQSGEFKSFGDDTISAELDATIRAPNGEDVLYVFHVPTTGRYLLFAYNLIRKDALPPIECLGYALFDDGTLIVMRGESEEAARVHPVQLWTTPFVSTDFASSQPTDGSLLAKLGNAELVRAISEMYSVTRLVTNATPSRRVYEEIITSAQRTVDAFHWLHREEVGDLKLKLEEIRHTGELIIDEFEKVQALRERAERAVAEATANQQQLVQRATFDTLASIDACMYLLTNLRTQRGRLVGLRDLRYVDVARVDELEAECIKAFDTASQKTVTFLLEDTAFAPLKAELEQIQTDASEIERSSGLRELRERIDVVGEGLDVLGEVLAGLEVDDPTSRTLILGELSEVFARLNQVRATVEARRRSIANTEGRAEFVAQLTLLNQSVASALNVSDSPERCDEQLSRLLLQLEDIEARFSEFDEFVEQLAAKREEILEGFETRKQSLMEARQDRARHLFGAAERILSGLPRRARTFKDIEELHTFFASDPMVVKLRQLSKQLEEARDGVRAQEVLGRLSSARQDALRGLRDRVDLFAEGDNIITLGRHRFAVSTEPFDLTVVPHNDRMCVHLTGTDFFEAIDDPVLDASRTYWTQHLISETRDIYRAEYLAAEILFRAENGHGEHSLESLHRLALDENDLALYVREVATARYDEGYDRGIHDADATKILACVLQLRAKAGLLRFPSYARAIGVLYWVANQEDTTLASLHQRIRALGRLRAVLGHDQALRDVGLRIANQLREFCDAHMLIASDDSCRDAADYLIEELQSAQPRFVLAYPASQLNDILRDQHDADGAFRDLTQDLESLDNLIERVELALAWVSATVDVADLDDRDFMRTYALESAVALALGDKADRTLSSATTSAVVDGLFGQHPRINEGAMELRLDAFESTMRSYLDDHVPAYRAYREARAAAAERERQSLRIEELRPSVMSSFVRNRLVDEIYLPLIGDNLAKQIGAAGEGNRTALMGLLLLISPPGYGKTTLMEYVADRLGLVFVKVNGPALGHGVTSLDPDEAPNATARQEVIRVNLALEMGNNVMLYVDDIQHTHPEFLQKFISLCDAQRRIEGVWKGRTRTYDMRGKKFCVVMAGNPYNEAGETFRVPDMLANRADTYNLGDIIGGREDVFALSYIENVITANASLSSLSTRDIKDIYALIRVARGAEVPASEFSFDYSAVEIQEFTTVLRHLFRIQELVLRVNQEYIASASQADEYRTEPPFKLQGSYRNMARMAEKVVAAMNESDLEQIIDDHYTGEAQTLTTGAEANLLKLAEIRGKLDDVSAKRWEEIKSEFCRRQRTGGREDDPVVRVTHTLSYLGQELEGIRTSIENATLGSPQTSTPATAPSWLYDVLQHVDSAASELALAIRQPELTPVVEAAQGIQRTIATAVLDARKRIGTDDASQSTTGEASAAGLRDALVAAFEQQSERFSAAIADTLSADRAQQSALLRELYANMAETKRPTQQTVPTPTPPTNDPRLANALTALAETLDKLSTRADTPSRESEVTVVSGLHAVSDKGAKSAASAGDAPTAKTLNSGDATSRAIGEALDRLAQREAESAEKLSKTMEQLGMVIADISGAGPVSTDAAEIAAALDALGDRVDKAFKVSASADGRVADALTRVASAIDRSQRATQTSEVETVPPRSIRPPLPQGPGPKSSTRASTQSTPAIEDQTKLASTLDKLAEAITALARDESPRRKGTMPLPSVPAPKSSAENDQLAKVLESLGSSLQKLHSSHDELRRSLARPTKTRGPVQGPSPESDAATTSAAQSAELSSFAGTVDRLAEAIASWRPPESGDQGVLRETLDKLGSAIETLSARPSATPPSPDPALLQTLDRIDSTLASLANARTDSADPDAAAAISERVSATTLQTVQTFENALSRQAVHFEQALMPLVSSSARNIEQSTQVNTRLVDLLDSLKEFLRRINRARDSA